MDGKKIKYCFLINVVLYSLQIAFIVNVREWSNVNINFETIDGNILTPMRLFLNENLNFKVYVRLSFIINIHVSTDVWRISSISQLLCFAELSFVVEVTDCLVCNLILAETVSFFVLSHVHKYWLAAPCPLCIVYIILHPMLIILFILMEKVCWVHQQDLYLSNKLYVGFLGMLCNVNAFLHRQSKCY